MMTDDERRDLVQATVVATLRQAGGWLDGFPRAELLDEADQIEATDLTDSDCCPACDEIKCDGDCPLATVR